MADADNVVEFIADDLAPGDGKSLDLDRGELDVARVVSAHDPLFASAYERLWNEFGSLHEMESREVIERRLAWHPVAMRSDCWLRYELMLVRHLGRFAAVRDHTAVVSSKYGAPQAVVHLSHVLVDEAWRRTGLAGWLRAFPIQTARACLLAAGFAADSPITLVAEMEHPDSQAQEPTVDLQGNSPHQEQHPQPQPQSVNRRVRLAAYERAGFKKVDPAAVSYFQPDFRPPEQIDASGGPRPLPFGLILRRIGGEEAQVLRGAELRGIVESLYWMYGTGFREQDMTVAWQSLRDYPGDDAELLLIAPTQ